jgi:hypothetical protein
VPFSLQFTSVTCLDCPVSTFPAPSPLQCLRRFPSAHRARPPASSCRLLCSLLATRDQVSTSILMASSTTLASSMSMLKTALGASRRPLASTAARSAYTAATSNNHSWYTTNGAHDPPVLDPSSSGSIRFDWRDRAASRRPRPPAPKPDETDGRRSRIKRERAAQHDLHPGERYYEEVQAYRSRCVTIRGPRVSPPSSSRCAQVHTTVGGGGGRGTPGRHGPSIHLVPGQAAQERLLSFRTLSILAAGAASRPSRGYLHAWPRHPITSAPIRVGACFCLP